MADFYTKANLEFKKYEKIVSDATATLERMTNNNIHHEKIVTEACDEIGRRVEEMRAKGTTGTSIKDYAGDAKITSLLGLIKQAKAKCDAGLKEFDAAKVQAKTAATNLAKLGKECKQEADERTKKKDAKLVALGQKSLPLIKKLADEASLLADTTTKEVVRGYELKAHDFDKQIDQAVKEAKDVAAKDTAEIGDRSMQEKRVFIKRRDQCVGAAQAVMKGCERAQAAIKASDAATARKELGTANEQMKIAMGHAKHYTDTLKATGVGLRRIYENDAKYAYIMPGIKAMQKLSMDAAKELKATVAEFKTMKEPA